MSNTALKAPIIAVNRHRILTDGEGITTLVAFNGCPLRCKYCLNPMCFKADTEKMMLNTSELYAKVRMDNLYFLASGGGITFGGGEPLLRADYIAEFCELYGSAWHNCMETSLNVPREKLETAVKYIDCFYIDCKDTNPDIYFAYTGKDNSTMLENLRWLSENVDSDKITVRVPLIKDFNTDEDRQKSVELLKTFGLHKFDLFEYIIR